jgi:hypothetical protein
VVTSRPWDVAFSKAALKDAKKLSQTGLRPKAEALIELIRRVKVLRMWTHYE